MNYHRIIPRLDIKGPNLVKGIHLEGLRVMGKPEFFAKSYYDQGADEIFFRIQLLVYIKEIVSLKLLLKLLKIFSFQLQLVED